MRLANLIDDGYFIGIAALNVIDVNRERVRDVSGRSFEALQHDRSKSHHRGGDYIDRLLQSLGD